ncbi:histidine kinase [Terrimonas sp. NA20]|uniref:Histidine kinase n=1 Tax=Terrimonas ginsenosidimutans TaxID=2908004 RepID=A0ABS9KU94_9BACT|nr:histidine kinase [Terrimonas ginsenosidimutans]
MLQKRRNILLAVFLQLILHFLPADTYSQRLLHTTYRLNENLYDAGSENVSGYIRVVYQTRNKLLFVGTKFGFCIYDGNKFRNYTRFGEKYIGGVNDFAELEDGRVAILSSTHGILVLDKNVLRAMPVLPQTPVARFFSFHRTTDNALLVSSNNGIYRFKHDHFVKTPVSGGSNANFYYDIENIDDDLLIASNGPGSPFILFDSKYHIRKKFPISNIVYDVQEDHRGNLWMATPAGLKKASRQKLLDGILEFETMPAPLARSGIDSKIVISLYADPYSNLWAGTAFGGLFRIDTLFNVTQFHFPNGFSFDRVNCFFEDAEHNLWLGTENGLVKIPDPRIVKYISNDGLQSSTINKVWSFNGDVLGISTSNIFQANEHANPKITLVDTLPEATSVFSTDKYLYAYSTRSLVQTQKINGRYQSKKTALKLPADLTFKRGAVAIDEQTFLFPLNTGGIFLSNVENGSVLNGISYLVEQMYYDHTDKLLWTSELNAGLRAYRVDKGLSLVCTDTSISRNVSAMSAGKNGTMWLATRDKGIFLVIMENNRLKVLQHITRQKGLSSDLYTSILESKEGKIFAGNIASVDIIQRIKDNYVINNLAAQLGYYNEVYSLAEDGFGNIWAGGLNGLLMLPADANLLSVNSSQTMITRMQLNDSIIDLHDLMSGRSFVLMPHQNDISFEFSSPYLKSESMVKYVYRLLRKGDTAWSQPFTNTTLALKDLPPGQFVFQVKALYAGGSITSNIAAVSFRILSPWYRSWWFLTLCVLSLAGLLYALYRYRLRQVIRLQQVRNRIASDLHDDIGSTLTNINILSSLGRRNLDEPAQAREFLDRITEEVNSSSQALDDIIWSVNTSNDGLDETAARMRRYAAELFDAGNVRYEFDLDSDLAQRKLSMEQRRDFYLVFKETLNNIFKHAEAKNVWINVQIEKGNLIMSVRDDGKGFDVNADTHRNGLKNLRARVNRWNGYIQVKSAPGMGTIIVVSMPVKA